MPVPSMSSRTLDSETRGPACSQAFTATSSTRTDSDWGTHPPDSRRDRSSRSSTSCWRRTVLRQMRSRKLWRRSSGGSSSRRVSENPRTAVSGVLSSWDALATKSLRTSSRRRISLTSTKVMTAPPAPSGRPDTRYRFSPRRTSRAPTAWEAAAAMSTWSSAERTNRLTCVSAGTGSTSRMPTAASLMRTRQASAVRATTPSLMALSTSRTSSRSPASSRMRASRSEVRRLKASTSSASSVMRDEPSGCMPSAPAAIRRARAATRSRGWARARAST